MSTKVNQLLQHWPAHTVATQALLSEHGIDRRTASKYVKSNWLDRIGEGAYRRPGQTIEWFGAVQSLQTQLHIAVHPGGISALEIHGYAHNITVGQRTTFVFAETGTRLPAWFNNTDWNTSIQLVTTSALSFDKQYLSNRTINDMSIDIACLELAALEMFYQVPQQQSYEEAFHVMEALTSLRPAVVRQLLESCTSIKTKRLFMHVSEQLKLPWVNRVNLAHVDFGEGKRTIHAGGQLFPKYQLVIDMM
jgi:hypothetical protein